MEKDNQLKQLLQNSSTGAPADFTDAVLKKVNALPAKLSPYVPLVSPRLRRIFLYVYGGVVFTLVSICAVLVFGTTDLFRQMHNSQLPNLDYEKIFLFIILFWFVYVAKLIAEKRSKIQN